MTSKRIALLCLIALLGVTGCGGSAVTTASSFDDVPGVVPADVPLVIAVDTDPESSQWQQLDELLRKFPDRDLVFRELTEDLAEEGMSFEDDVLPALGDETYLVFLDLEDEGDNVAVLTKPRDRAKFDELVRRADEPVVTRELDGWTAAAPTQAVLDRLGGGGARLADAAWFLDARERVGEDALAALFANGPELVEALEGELEEGCEPPAGLDGLEHAAGVVTAEDDGVRLRLVAAGDGVGGLADDASLLGLVPAGVFGYIGMPALDTGRFSLGEQAGCALGMGEAEALGTSLEDIGSLFAGGFALYGRSGGLLPEVTLLLAPADRAQALATLDGLVESLGAFGGLKVERRRVGEVDARALALGPVTLLYGVSDDKLVVTLSPRAFELLEEGGQSLAEDPAFQAARGSAGVGEDDEVFAYLDLQELVRLAEGLAGLGGEAIPPDVSANLAPLDSFIAWGDLDSPDEVEVGAFVAIR